MAIGGKEGEGESPPDGPKVVIADETTKASTRAKRLWDITSRPDYAHEGDGVEALMAETTLYYSTHGNTFVDEAYALRDFRKAEIWARDVRRARVTAGDLPADQSTLGGYQEAYRSYINHRRKNRGGEEVLGSMMARQERATSSRWEETTKKESAKQSEVSPEKGK